MTLRTTFGGHSLARKSRAERRSISCSSEKAKSIADSNSKTGRQAGGGSSLGSSGAGSSLGSSAVAGAGGVEALFALRTGFGDGGGSGAGGGGAGSAGGAGGGSRLGAGGGAPPPSSPSPPHPPRA